MNHRHFTAVWLFLITAAIVAGILSGCDNRNLSALEQVKSKGKLVVATRNSSTTYYEGPDGRPTGFEYDLLKMFADSLGVKLKIVVPESFSSILPKVENGKVHFAAAGLTVTEARKRKVRFALPYQQITQQLVYRLGTTAPSRIEDLLGADLEVMAESSHVERLRELQSEFPLLSWRENRNMESEELLTFVWEQMIDYTVADSNELSLSQRYYPELRVAFDLTDPQSLAWAFPISDDSSLYDAANEFLDRISKNGELEQIKERYYGHTDKFDYVGTLTFISHIYERLPTFRDHFEEASAQSGIDWRLLAAMGYQESHWDPTSVSPTGVRGIMMLTLDTARQLGITNRLDPAQSIMGGARYLNSLRERISPRILEPDRTWMAVAAYNVGFGHLEDARIITRKRGFDPDKWIHVKESLPLLRKQAWYSQTRHGYARGHEPVLFVQNIRNYYDLLVRNADQPDPRNGIQKYEFNNIPLAI